MTRESLKESLEKIEEAALLACSYINDMTKEYFFQDRRTQDATILRLVVIAETTKKIENENPEFIQNYPEIPWKKIRGLRNRIVHDYFSINLKNIWETLNVDLPVLIKNLKSYFESQANNR
jgi:uncharacterized protein with HEPN domain